MSEEGTGRDARCSSEGQNWKNVEERWRSSIHKSYHVFATRLKLVATLLRSSIWMLVRRCTKGVGGMFVGILFVGLGLFNHKV